MVQSVALYSIFNISAQPLRRGWDQTGSNGANLSFPTEFGIGAVAGEPNQDRDNWLVGLVNSAPYIASSFLWVFHSTLDRDHLR
jgi:hypothetical protein